MKKTIKELEAGLPFVQDAGRRRFYYPQEPSPESPHSLIEGRLWAIDLLEFGIQTNNPGLLHLCVSDALGIKPWALPRRLIGMLKQAEAMAAAVVGGLGADRFRSELLARLEDSRAVEAEFHKSQHKKRCASLAKARAAKAAKRAAAA